MLSPRLRGMLRRAAVAVPVVLALLVAPAMTGTAHADKVYSKKISRAEVIARAHYWLAANVQYSQSKYYQDPEGTGPSSGGYRTDCSGFISMAWHLNQSRWTGNLADVATRISKSSMKKGDMILNQSGGHVALFEYWVDKSAGKFRVIEQANSADDMRNGYGYTGSGRFASSNYQAYRYNKIFDEQYNADNETPRRDESGAQCKYSRPGDPTIDLPNRRDVYISVRTCIRQEYVASNVWRYRAWISLYWEPGRDGDDSSNTSKKRFDGFYLHPQVQHKNNTVAESRCYLHNNINASYNGHVSCQVTYTSSTNDDEFTADGLLNWDKDGDGKRWLKPWYAHGSPKV